MWEKNQYNEEIYGFLCVVLPVEKMNSTATNTVLVGIWLNVH